jgi:hypothetical protein
MMLGGRLRERAAETLFRPSQVVTLGKCDHSRAHRCPNSNTYGDILHSRADSSSKRHGQTDIEARLPRRAFLLWFHVWYSLERAGYWPAGSLELRRNARSIGRQSAPKSPAECTARVTERVTKLIL